MAIRDKLRLGNRKSISSTTTNHTDSTADAQELTKTPSRLAKTLTWRSSKRNKKNDPPAQPVERPFTEQNLKHQELLNAFTMSFGRRRASQAGRTSFGGVSPGTSRQCSVDAAMPGHAAALTGNRGTSSLANEVPQAGSVAEGGPVSSS